MGVFGFRGFGFRVCLVVRHFLQPSPCVALLLDPIKDHPQTLFFTADRNVWSFAEEEQAMHEEDKQRSFGAEISLVSL